jgi:hypothetical protein
LLPVDCLVGGLPAIVLVDDAVARIVQGQAALVDTLPGTTGLVRLYDQARQFLGLGELQATRLLPKRLVATPKAALRGAAGQGANT